MPSIITEQPRKVVPQATYFRPHVDERVALVDKVKKALGNKAKGMHFFFGDKEIAATDRYKDDGYETTGYNHRGDPLLMRPEAMHKEHLASIAMDSQAIKQSAATGEGANYKTTTAEGIVLGPQKE